MSRLVSRSAAAPRLPLSAKERLVTLDVLRGFALLGVLLANITEIASFGVVMTAQQMNALATAPMDIVTELVVGIFITDKARTILSVLFGAGFILLYARYLEAGRPALRLYAWRLAVLFLIGLLHLIFLWTWDILTVYAVSGLCLALVARWSVRALLCVAIGLFFLVQVDWWAIFDSVERFSDISVPDVEYERPVLAMQALSRQGDYLGLVAYFWEDTVASFWGGSFLFGVLATVPLMMIGAALMKMGWLRDPAAHRKTIGRWAMGLLPLGLFLEVIQYDFVLEIVPDVILSPVQALPLMDYAWVVSPTLTGFGYLFAALWLLAPMRSLSGMAGVLAAFGRMALTNYVTQSVFIGWLLFGVGPGLGLAGTVGTSFLICAGIGLFWVQAFVSVYWLRAFGIGPLEYIWRVSCGQRVPMFGRVRAVAV